MPDLVKDTNHLLHAYFDKVLVLTVPRFTERHDQVRERLAGIDFDFFYGTDKKELTKEFIREHYHYNKKASLSIRQHFPPLNHGEIACSLSHRSIYQAMIEENWKRVLILEDDVVPDWSHLSVLPYCLQELPENWELFYLGYLKNKEKPATWKKLKQTWYKIMAVMGTTRIPLAMIRNWLPEDYSPHLLKAGFHDCTHGYAVTLGAAHKLLKSQTPVVQRADNLLTALVLKGELNAFASKEFLFNQEVFTDTKSPSHIRDSWAGR